MKNNFPGITMVLLILINTLVASYVPFNKNKNELVVFEQPFEGLEAARKAVQQLKKEKKLPKGKFTVYIKPGIYPVDSTIRFGAEDSGTEQTEIIYKPYNGQLVQFIGGRKVEGFEPLSNEKALKRIDPEYHDKIYQINLKGRGIENYGTIKPTGFGRKSRPQGLDLFFNGDRMTMARFPNRGWSRIDSVPQTGKQENRGLERIKRYGIPIGKHFGRFTYKGSEPNNWVDDPNIWLHGFWTHDYAESYVSVARIDTAMNEFILRRPHGIFGYTKNQRYYAFNILEELDSPGEWYLDRETGILYFWPPTPIDKGSVFISLLEDEMVAMDSVSNVSLEGFYFEYTRGIGVKMSNCKNTKIAGCTVRNIGTRGIVVENGYKNGIQSCEIYNIGDEGMVVSGGDRKTLTSGENYIDNNHIYNFSSTNWMNAGIKLDGVGTRVSHNRIHDAPSQGVIFDGNDHLLEYNEIHDLAKESGDVGGFYIGRDWTKRGNIVRYNYFHHIHAPGAHGVNSVYLDDASSGNKVHANLFYDVDRGVLMGGGHDNEITNNVFIKSKIAIFLDARGLTWAKDYIVEKGGWQMYKKLDDINYKNPPYSTQYPALASILDKNPAIPSGNVIENNICFGNGIRLLDGAKKEYYSVENNEVIKEIPGYINVVKGEIYPKSKSVLKKLNIEKIPLKEIGLYSDKYQAQ